MFSPAPMLQVSALVMERDARAVLRDWGRQGAVQLTHTAPGPETPPLTPPDHGRELARCERLLARIKDLHRSLELAQDLKPLKDVEGTNRTLRPRPSSSSSEPPPQIEHEDEGRGRNGAGPRRFVRRPQQGPVAPRAGPQPPGDDCSPTALTGQSMDQAESALHRLERRAGELLARRQHLTKRIEELSGTCQQLAGYLGLDLPLDELDQFAFLHFVTGSLPKDNWAALQQQAGPHMALLPLLEQEERQPLIALTTHRSWPALQAMLQRAGFQSERLPRVQGATSDSLSEHSLHERQLLNAELTQLTTELRTFAIQCARLLEQIQHQTENERRLLVAEQYFHRTETVVLLTGWIPSKTASALQQRLQEITSGCSVVETAAPETFSSEVIPILLQHPRWLRPFERLVSAYGLPRYRELEPTLFVALSYLLMFGVMFGDVGHGAVLALGGLAAWIGTRVKKIRDVGLLLLFGGLSSMWFGWVYGSCFGLAFFKHHALWHDPLEGDPTGFIYGAIGVGVALISLGLILNVINRFRYGDVIGACLDKFGLVGVLFYWGTLVLLLRAAAFESRGLMTLAMALFVGLPLVGWAVKEPLEYFMRHRTGQGESLEQGLFTAMTESLVGAFEAVLSYLANTISFVRLAAYAMSHAALLAAAFSMAAEAKQISVGGGLLAVLIIVAGNLVAILLEGVIASVQALRLEYYEFFGKFFSGQGQSFEPFRLASEGRAPAV